MRCSQCQHWNEQEEIGRGNCMAILDAKTISWPEVEVSPAWLGGPGTSHFLSTKADFGCSLFEKAP